VKRAAGIDFVQNSGKSRRFSAAGRTGREGHFELFVSYLLQAEGNSSRSIIMMLVGSCLMAIE
jgi:hypothetical protein